MEGTTTAVNAILNTYHVDLPHTRMVAALALGLFDAVAGRYQLPDRARPLLEAGALLHDVALASNPPEHHLVGRDVVLRQPIDGLSQRDQLIVACLVAFHRKRARPQQEPAFLALPTKSQALALQLAAILRVADGLDFSHAQTTRVIEVVPGDGLSLRIEGRHAADDGARAMAKADLWRKAFGETLYTSIVELGPPEPQPFSPSTEEPAETAPSEPTPPWYATPDAPLAELGRILLRRHLRRMLIAERAVRADRAIEDVHALRVASRRLRATLRLLAPVAPAERVRPVQKAIRRLARAAGAVRDRDVLLDNLAQSRARLPAELHAGLDELSATIGAERASAYTRLITLFDSPEHADFKANFAELMCTRTGWDEAPHVRDLAGSTIWRRYEALRAHDSGGIPLEGEAMHALRIDAKKLRYVLELFADSFGERAEPVVTQLASLQDELGLLNDTMVAQTTLAETRLGPGAQPAAEAYLALRQAEQEAAQVTIASRWARLTTATYRRKLMELIVRL
jgi:CHAD domain-containing protein